MRRFVFTALLFAMGAATAAALMAWRRPPDATIQEAAIVSPTRTAVDPPAVPAPPTLATQAAALAPLSFVLETTRSSKAGRRRSKQAIFRTHDRVRLVLEGARQEWLFVQNAAYTTRATGYLTDHDKREIYVHEESSLRSLMGIKGWMDVLTIRFDPAVLATLRDAGERREAGGEFFQRYVASQTHRAGVSEVWWSEALLLPLSITVREAGSEVTSSVKDMRWSVDTTQLEEPSARFPGYKLLDPADAADHR